MGKLVQSVSVSLDGFFEGPGHDLSWHLVDDELHRHFNDTLRGAGAFLDGRIAYELMADFWPTADADPDAPEPVREFAAIWRDTPKVVYSRTLTEAGWGTTIVREVVPADVRALAASVPGDVAVGGGKLSAAFRRLGLIDELSLYVHPVLIGRGTPFFTADDGGLSLTLLQTRAFGNGVVQLRYSVGPGT